MENPIKKIYELKAITINTINKKNLDDSKGILKSDFFSRDFYSPLIAQIKSSISKYTPNDELVELLEEWLIEISMISDSNKIINGYWAKFKIDLTNIKNDISKSIFELDQRDSIDDTSDKFLKIPIIDVADMYKAELSQDEVILLFLYLRDLKLIDEVKENVLSMSINALTGHSFKQIQKKIYGKAKIDKYLITDDQLKYDKLCSKLESIIEKIKLDRAN